MFFYRSFQIFHTIKTCKMSSAVSFRWIPHHAKTAWRLYKKSHWTSLLRPKLLVKPGCTSAFSSSSSRHQMECQRLEQRTLIRVAGTDAEEFLQGLVTNDLQCFHQHDCKSLYSMVLNLKVCSLSQYVLGELLFHLYLDTCILIII